MPILDTNVLLRHFLGDHNEQSPRAGRVIEELGAGTLRAQLPEPVVFELVFTLERREHHTREVVRDLVLGLFDLPGVSVPNKELLVAAFNIHVEQRLSLVDAYIAVTALAAPSPQIISFDRGFDRIPGVTRVEP